MSYVVQSKTGSSYLQYLPAPDRWTWNAPDLRFATRFPTQPAAEAAITQLPESEREYVGRIIVLPEKQ